MTEIIIILALLILNGLFAMCEIALVSSRKSKLEQSAKQGSKGAKTALDLLKEPEKFLSTVQI
jgi:putative hemolysin